MTNKVLNNSTLPVEKLRSTLQDLTERLANKGALSEIIGESLRAFKSFYQGMGEPDFSPKHLETGDNPNSKLYNQNFSSIDSDITRFYSSIDALATAQIESFNYAAVSNQELVKRADGLASLVLDLKILSDFTRGDVLVAGDDFRTLDTVDTKIATAAPKAEKMFGIGGMSLKRKENNNLITDRTTVEIFPLAPVRVGELSMVNMEPTPGNLERFYEGAYYAFLGEARPEGSRFNLKFLLRPKTDNVKVDVGTTVGIDPDKPPEAGGGGRGEGLFAPGGVRGWQSPPPAEKKEEGGGVIDDSNKYDKAGFFVEIGASEEERQAKRKLMFDEDPATFWEAEYVFHTKTPLIKDSLLDFSSVVSDNSNVADTPRTASVVIDYKEAERIAKSFDFEGRDLIVEIVITFPEPVPANYVVFDPILFGSTAFPEVLEISTAAEDEGQFRLVDGWDLSKYAKTITPEANEFLNDVQVGQLLSPSRFEYTGKGVFPFPSRIAKKVKIRLKMDNPVPAVYERYYILLRNQLDVETEVTTKKTKGLFR